MKREIVIGLKKTFFVSNFSPLWSILLVQLAFAYSKNLKKAKLKLCLLKDKIFSTPDLKPLIIVQNNISKDDSLRIISRHLRQRDQNHFIPALKILNP
jgi:hypothetical protein